VTLDFERIEPGRRRWAIAPAQGWFALLLVALM
jgi:hypothetical protein